MKCNSVFIIEEVIVFNLRSARWPASGWVTKLRIRSGVRDPLHRGVQTRYRVNSAPYGAHSEPCTISHMVPTQPLVEYHLCVPISPLYNSSYGVHPDPCKIPPMGSTQPLVEYHLWGPLSPV